MRSVQQVYEIQGRVRPHARTFGSLAEAGLLVRRILMDHRFPAAEDAAASRHPAGRGKSSVAWMPPPDGWYPLVALSEDMQDELTVIHECAHILRNGPAYIGKQGNPAIAHDQEWFDTFHRLVQTYATPKMHVTFEYEFGLSPSSPSGLTPMGKRKVSDLTDEQLAEIVSIREEHQGEGQLTVCGHVTSAIERHLGFPKVMGFFDGIDNTGRKVWTKHAWNLLPDGRVLDATADQFGFEGIRITDGSDYEPMTPEQLAWMDRFRQENYGKEPDMEDWALRAFEGSWTASVENDPKRWQHRQRKWDLGEVTVDRSKKVGEYTLHLHRWPDGDYEIWVTTVDGEVVGQAYFGPINDHIEASPGVRIDHRRRGIATAMYSWMEEITGKTLQPGEGHSQDAEGLWMQPNRPFGKTAVVEPGALAEAIDLAQMYCELAGGARAGTCWTAAWTIRKALGWPIVEGERDGLRHAWNLMPDGRYFDPTAAQFGEQGSLTVDSDDSRYHKVAFARGLQWQEKPSSGSRRAIEAIHHGVRFRLEGTDEGPRSGWSLLIYEPGDTVQIGLPWHHRTVDPRYGWDPDSLAEGRSHFDNLAQAQEYVERALVGSGVVDEMVKRDLFPSGSIRYHVTLTRHVPSIMSRGLEPRSQVGTGVSVFEKLSRVITIMWDLKDEDWANHIGESISLLRLDVSDLPRSTITSLSNEERVNQTIPPDRISVLISDIPWYLTDSSFGTWNLDDASTLRLLSGDKQEARRQWHGPEEEFQRVVMQGERYDIRRGEWVKV